MFIKAFSENGESCEGAANCCLYVTMKGLNPFARGRLLQKFGYAVAAPSYEINAASHR